MSNTITNTTNLLVGIEINIGIIDIKKMVEVIGEEEHSEKEKLKCKRRASRTKSRNSPRKARDRRRLWGGYNKKKAWDNKYNKNNKWNNYNNKWNNNKWNNKNWNNKPSPTTPSPTDPIDTPSPTPWIKDRICIDPNDNIDSSSDRRRLWGYRSRSRDGCNNDDSDDKTTPSPTEDPDGFIEWYKDKCPTITESDGWDGNYISNGYGTSPYNSNYGSRYTSWSKRKDQSDEFITEVCVTYNIDILNNGVDLRSDCIDIQSVFLGLCENQNTDFNSSTLNERDLESLVVSIN